MLQLRTDNQVDLEFTDLPPISKDEAFLWRHPPAGRIAWSSVVGAASGALLSASLFPSDPALLFGAVLGAYAGFLGAAVFARGRPAPDEGGA